MTIPGPLITFASPEAVPTRDLTAITVRRRDTEERLTFKGRQAWALGQLVRAGRDGCTPITHPGPRWSDYTMKIRRAGLIADYIARCIRELKRFARLYGVIVIVVAHPTKEVGKGGVARTVTLYDIADSAAWFNKCDHGIVVERADHNSTQCTVYVQKSRFEEAGRKAALAMNFNQDAMRFAPLDLGYGGAT